MGCGEPIIINFYAQLDPADNQIHYNYRKLGEDLALIQSDQTQYCMKQVHKMCFYVQKLYHTEIIRMKCLFVKDYNGTIWFQHAQDIFVRVNQFAKMAYEQQVQDMADLQLKNKQKVLRQRMKENIIKK